MAIKCIALDLDGTTLNDDKSITISTRNAIDAAVARGIHVVIASGRCLEALPGSVTEIPGIELAITSNGAAVYELATGTCIHQVHLSVEAVDRILKITEEERVIHEVFCHGIPYAFRGYVEDPVAYGAMPYAENYIRSTRKPVENIRQFIFEHREEIDGIDLITRNQRRREELWEKVKLSVPDVYITSSVINRVEIASDRAGKHNGLACVLKRLGISPEETAAFGDADNDVEMLSYVKYGMAVANATNRCKKAAFKVVPSNAEDGVAVGIESYLLTQNEQQQITCDEIKEKKCD